MFSREPNFAVSENGRIIAIFEQREAALTFLESLGVRRPTADPGDHRRMARERYQIHGVHSTARIGDDANVPWSEQLPEKVRDAWMEVFRAEQAEDTDPGWG